MNTLISLFDSVKSQYGEKYLREVLNAVDNNVKVNRIAFKKKTSIEEYINIFNITNYVFSKYGKGGESYSKVPEVNC